MPAEDDDTFSAFDEILRGESTAESPWEDGAYIPRNDVLRRLLQIPLAAGDSQQSGRVAKAFDAWIAFELRRAGFDPNAVWPRTRQPRVLPDDLASLEARLDLLDQRLADTEQRQGKRLEPPALRQAIVGVRKALPGVADTRILGDFYVKQIDVAVSSWRRGPEILISSKTMFSSFKNNLRNRHEEAVGEVASLRRRHPMAAMGFAFLVHEGIHQVDGAYIALADIVRRLKRPGAFDATLLFVGDWDLEAETTEVTNLDEPAPDLGASRFFTDLIAAVTERTPYTEHPDVRFRRDGAPTDGVPDDEDLDD